jgi:hypothetical protein
MIIADAGLPMLMLAWPWAFLLIFPIVIIEAFSSQWFGTPLRKRLTSIFVANIVSTIAGWPLAWWIMVGLQMKIIPGGGGVYGLNTTLGKIASVTLQSAWLLPYEDSMYWMVPAASAFLMIPFFLMSVILEDQTLMYALPDLTTRERRKSVWKANILSYCLLLLIFFIWLAYALITHKK